MKTIKGLIAAGLAETEAARRIIREESMMRVYKDHPDLKEIDGRIIDIRKDRLIAVIDHDEKLAKRYDVEEANLLSRRELIMKENHIDPEFDMEKSICSKCGDTGFVKGKDGTPRVCSCKQAELEECYESCGLGDYTSFTMKNYRDDYLGDPEKRYEIKKQMLRAMLGVGDTASKPIWVYSGAPQTGKTYLSVIMTKTAISLGKSAFFIKCENLASLESDTIEDIKRIDFLVIDDFADDVTLHGDVGSVLNSVLEIRAASGLCTILVSALPLSDLVNGCDMRVSGKLGRAGKIS
jgi:DNA replication protein DnaC